MIRTAQWPAGAAPLRPMTQYSRVDRNPSPRKRAAGAPGSAIPLRLLTLVVLASAIYDLVLGGALLFALDEVGALLGIEPPRFRINQNLNGLFAMAVGAGYLAVLRNPWERRWYLWIMGPALKGGGALLFVLDFLLRGSPPVFLAFAACDGILAVATVFVLVLAAPRPPEEGVGIDSVPTANS